MLRFLARRLTQMVALFVVFLTIVWLLLHAMPGDISDTLIGNPEIPMEARLELRQRLGLDQPLHLQYLTYLGNFLRGEMGVSLSRYPEDVSTLLWQALPRTLVLFLTSTLLAFWLGFRFGKVIAWRRGGKTEKGWIVGGVLLQTVFYPWFAIMMLWLFGFRLGWFPIGRFADVDLWRGAPYDAGDIFERMIVSALAVSLAYALGRYLIMRISPGRVSQLGRALGGMAAGGIVLYWYLHPARTYVADIAHHTLLPVVTLGLVLFGATLLITRSSMLETLEEDYVLTARAKGLSERAIRDRHAARNAMLPITTSLVLALAFVIGGGIVTESVFSWPGMGLLLLDAVAVEDIPLAMGVLAYTGVLVLVGHLAADVLYAVLDPRIRIS